MAQDKLQENYKRSVDWLICHLRWVWIFIAAFSVQAHVFSSTRETDLRILYSLLAVIAIYNLIILALLALKWFRDEVSIALAILDIAFSIGLMWFSGGYNSLLLPALAFPVLTTALRFNGLAGLLAATPAALAFTFSVILSRVNGADIFIQISISVITLFLIGGVAGYLSDIQLAKQAENSSAETKRLRLERERANALYEMANTLSSTLNYRKVLKALIDLAQMALAEADDGEQHYDTVGMVLLFDDTGPLSNVRLVDGRNIPKTDENTVVSAQEGLLGQVIYKKAEAMVTNLNPQKDPSLNKFLALQKCQSFVCAPLRAGYDMFGVVLFASPTRDFYSDEHADLLSTFCSQATVAMQNAQLYEDLALEQQKLLEKEAQARRELARNLHDGPTQDISAIAMRLNFVQMLLTREGNIPKSVEELQKVEQLALKTTQNIRSMLFTLRPVVLETQGLKAAIEQYAARLRDLDNMNISLNIAEYDGQLSTNEESVLFAIIEEALGNAKKYARTADIRINLGLHNGVLIAQVADNGPGFDLEQVKASYDQRGSLGLLNMDERANMIGGRCQLQSAVGKGTRVTVTIPLNRRNTVA